MSSPVFDLNADVGEGFDDDGLLGSITSANVACGVHAGDDATMRRVCERAVEAGITIGAQVSYDDREGFGRRPMDVEPDDLALLVSRQVDALAAHAHAAGGAVAYVKPHGALYNRAAVDPSQAAAIVRGVLAAETAAVAGERGLAVLSLPGSALAREAERAGLLAVAEAFADRGYQPDGTLVPRARSGAVIDDPEVVAERAVDMAWGWPILDADGGELLVVARSLCIHGDTDGAAELARTVRAALEGAGVAVRPFTQDAA